MGVVRDAGDSFCSSCIQAGYLQEIDIDDVGQFWQLGSVFVPPIPTPRASPIVFKITGCDRFRPEWFAPPAPSLKFRFQYWPGTNELCVDPAVPRSLIIFKWGRWPMRCQALLQPYKFRVLKFFRTNVVLGQVRACKADSARILGVDEHAARPGLQSSFAILRGRVFVVLKE